MIAAVGSGWVSVGNTNHFGIAGYQPRWLRGLAMLEVAHGERLAGLLPPRVGDSRESTRILSLNDDHQSEGR